jgi:hypothetical protein
MKEEEEEKVSSVTTSKEVENWHYVISSSHRKGKRDVKEYKRPTRYTLVQYTLQTNRTVYNLHSYT